MERSAANELKLKAMRYRYAHPLPEVNTLHEYFLNKLCHKWFDGNYKKKPKREDIMAFCYKNPSDYDMEIFLKKYK